MLLKLVDCIAPRVPVEASNMSITKLSPGNTADVDWKEAVGMRVVWTESSVVSSFRVKSGVGAP